jgi:carboxyl-terminal processing protease
MLKRVSLSERSWQWLVVLAALLSSTVYPSAPAMAAPTATEQVTIAAEALPTAVSGLLKKGQALESSGRWGEALAHYEEALREQPNDRALNERFDTARLHYSLQQRYGDRSFRDSVQTLRPQESLGLYSDILSKIDAHYYTTPPWQELAQRGAQAMDIALADSTFLRTHAVRTSSNQLNQLRQEIRQLPGRYSIRSSRDAAAVAAEVARLASRRVGLNESATLLEFTAAAGGGLDHFSAFLTADQLRDIYSQIEGSFVGLGVELKADDGALLIVHVIPGSPAEKAGILPDDRIIAVDGQSTKQLSTDEAASLLTGPEGSLVRVTVITPGEASRVLPIRRASVDVPSLEEVKIIDPQSGVAYIRIPAFQKTTARDLEAALWDLHRQGMRSLVIDVRGNPGGLLTASVEAADEFIASGSIVSTRGRSDQENFDYRAHRPGTWRVPLVVLVDGDSASASEIFAGAIKDSGRGLIVGSRSYGKGSVQGIFPLSSAGAGARITTAMFFSPNGHPISKIGITPDIDARRATSVAQGPESSSEGTHLVGYRGAGNSGRDVALELAIQAVRNQPVAAL